MRCISGPLPWPNDAIELRQLMEIRKIITGELQFDCRVSGNEENELVIFLHGFPETSFMWINLMKKLAALGYFCVAPDMRGYSENACPKGVEYYHLKKLSDDILNIAHAMNRNQFHLVGHDWGAGIGWNIVYQYPEKIKSWTALSVPHPRAFSKAIKTDKEQGKKSRYIGWFLIPVIPEIMLRKNDFEKLRKLWKNSSPKELDNYLLSKKGATFDYPFDDKVRVYRIVDKMFALMADEEPLSINLKCDPIYALELRSLYGAVKAGYHMNKKHWNTVTLGGDVDDALLKELIDHSYELVYEKLTRKQRELVW